MLSVMTYNVRCRNRKYPIVPSIVKETVVVDKTKDMLLIFFPSPADDGLPSFGCLNSDLRRSAGGRLEATGDEGSFQGKRIDIRGQSAPVADPSLSTNNVAPEDLNTASRLADGPANEGNQAIEFSDAAVEDKMVPGVAMSRKSLEFGMKRSQYPVLKRA